ncbi:MAG TPA: zf-HC2 domain-containing protein, partial [Gemmatimonadaceae bacterium]|nr:zf-HC2 domain-containing protein [Gemmatimonadaceae bacterium]
MQHLDEGTIHAWLDGALGTGRTRDAELHVAACRECAERVAEARGLIAASSRILMALDHVPADVVPAAERRVAMAAAA